jgi:ABC-2 type transport system ATP-binding protein
MNAILETKDLSKRYGRHWALRGCTFTLTAGKIAALVGPNGAGKTTLLHLATGLLSPTKGEVIVMGASPCQQPQKVLPHIGFVAQDHPLYRRMKITELMKMGQKMNPRWDNQIVSSRLQRLGIDLSRSYNALSGGQQAQVALALALGKRPDLLLLDEPLASLDPLARREFMRALMDATTEMGTTVLLSSHNIADLERMCDYLILLTESHLQLVDEIDNLIATHKRLVGPADHISAIDHGHTIIEQQVIGRQAIIIVRTTSTIFDPAWMIENVTLEEIVMAYLGLSQQQHQAQFITLLKEAM